MRGGAEWFGVAGAVGGRFMAAGGVKLGRVGGVGMVMLVLGRGAVGMECCGVTADDAVFGCEWVGVRRALRSHTPGVVARAENAGLCPALGVLAVTAGLLAVLAGERQELARPFIAER